MRYFLTAFFTLSCIYSSAQSIADTTSLKEVIVSGIQETQAKQTVLNTEAYSLKELESHSPYNLSDALAKLPGISQISTGNAISKPVIRGLYGNRVLVLLSGLRFDNQQFQDEHGLGLSQIGIDRIEVIKGPASLLYGTDAIGGIVNIIEATPMQTGHVLDINTRLYSNTLGTLTDIGYSKNKNKTWWRIRAGAESHADYTDGNNVRVLNSRNQGYYFKAGYGFQHGRWIQNNSYNFSYSHFGFILDALQPFTPDGRFARNMAGPHHNVMLHLFSSENTLRLKRSTLRINVGVQSNSRKEDEGGGAISLNMHLLSILENAKWEKPIGKNLLFIANQQFTFENNTNYGKRILIPDANMLEGNLSAFLHYNLHKIVLEAGIGWNDKWIKTRTTGTLNLGSSFVPDTSLRAFSKNRSATNFMAGLSYNPNSWLNIKANMSTGSRAGNLAELSSNGLHEGTYRCEIGDPNLKMEQNFNADVSVEIDKKLWFFSASGFYNHFNNYIYLTLSAEPDWYGFPRYRYTQQNATLYGGELMLIGKLSRATEAKNIFSATKGLLDAGGNLPFIPAYKNTTAIKWTSHQLHKLYIEPELEYVFRQDYPARFETSTTDYALLNINTGFISRFHDKKVSWNMSCRNILNKVYADHLSRLKYYGINNPGINFILSARMSLNNK